MYHLTISKYEAKSDEQIASEARAIDRGRRGLDYRDDFSGSMIPRDSVILKVLDVHLTNDEFERIKKAVMSEM